MDNKFIFAGLFFVCIVLSGIWLSHSGKPINVLILTIHKLISLGAVVFLAVTLYRIHQAASLGPIQIAVSVVTLLLFIGMFASGGLLSAGKGMPPVVLKLHQIMPFLVILSTGANLYLALA